MLQIYSRSPEISVFYIFLQSVWGVTGVNKYYCMHEWADQNCLKVYVNSQTTIKIFFSVVGFQMWVFFLSKFSNYLIGGKKKTKQEIVALLQTS